MTRGRLDGGVEQRLPEPHAAFGAHVAVVRGERHDRIVGEPAVVQRLHLATEQIIDIGDHAIVATARVAVVPDAECAFDSTVAKAERQVGASRASTGIWSTRARSIPASS